MANGAANTKKARENWYKNNARAQELAVLFPGKGGVKRKTRKALKL